MKKSSLVVLLLVFFINGFAQINSPFLQKTAIGLKMGINTANIMYTENMYNDYNKDLLLRKHFGIFASYRFSNILFFRPEMLFINKGVKINEDFDYSFEATYLEVGMPLGLYFLRMGNLHPYLLAGPYFSVVREGVIKFDDFELAMTNGNVKGTEAGLRFGIGVQYPQRIGNMYINLGGEVSYDYGLTDTWSEAEHNGESFGVNINPYEIEGKRKNRALLFSLTISIRLSELVRTRPTPEQEEVVIDEPTIEEPDTIVPEVIKPCYSIEEINQMLAEGKSIQDKTICMTNITFEIDKAIIKNESKPFLDAVVLMLQNNPNMKMNIYGHTDDLGSDEYNMQLSVKRAKSVVDYLVSKGIDANRLSSQGFGETKPIDKNDTEEGRRNNRRVEFEIIQQ